MICISHLLPDEEMKEFTQKYGTGIESIDFSISDNLDHLSETVENYRKKMETMVINSDRMELSGPVMKQ